MNYVYCALMGYLVGSANPSYMIAKLQGFDIRQKGSGNAGASNALILFGKVMGVLCAVFDILKATAIIWLTGKLFPMLTYAFPVTSVACILGHIFPFYMKFRGGKGLACLGGVILAYDFRVFMIMLAGEIVIALVTNYICFVPLTASAIFPVVYGVMQQDVLGAILLNIATVVIIFRHLENIRRIREGKELRLSFLWNKEKELERMQIPKDMRWKE